jgi:hypothetical protein
MMAETYETQTKGNQMSIFQVLYIGTKTQGYKIFANRGDGYGFQEFAKTFGSREDAAIYAKGFAALNGLRFTESK